MAETYTVTEDSDEYTVADDGETVSVGSGTTEVDITVTTINGVSSEVPADQKLYIGGTGNDTYFIYNTSTDRLELFVNGSMKGAWKND